MIFFELCFYLMSFFYKILITFGKHLHS
jgi:hypothetical protein